MDDGEGFRRRIHAVVRQIPRGRVATYGQVASLAGSPRAARAAGTVLARLPGPLLAKIPWQRVVGSTGRISPRDDEWSERQRELLEREGIHFGRGGRIDLLRYGWKKSARGRRPARR